MTFTRTALSNLRRNPARSVLTALSLVVAAATLSTVLSLDRGYSSAVTEELVQKTGVHLYVTKEGCPIEAASVIAQGGLSPLYVSQALVPAIEADPAVDAVLPFQLFSVTTADGSRTDIFMGVTESIRRIKPDWTLVRGGWFDSDSAVVLGAEIARLEQRQVGDRIYSEHFQREFTVRGILERNYTQDDGTIFLPLATAQQLVGREGKLSAVAVKLKDIGSLDAARAALRARLPADYYVIGAKELSDGLLEFFRSTRVIMFVMVGVAFLISVFGVVNTMLMAVLERRREIAYLKCMGAGRGDLLRLIATETFALCLVGSAVGTLAGVLLSPLAGHLLRGSLVAYVPAGAIARPDAGIAALSFVTCLALGTLGSLVPALRAGRIVPMEVLRND
jgi:putative ABC transport system permease protein